MSRRSALTRGELLGQTVVVIGGSAGIGLETARRARAEGADVILTARDPSGSNVPRRDGGTEQCGLRRHRLRTLGQFFDELPAPIDHVLVTGPGPYYAPLAELDFDEARRDVEAHLWLPIQVARHARARCAREGPCCSWAAPAAVARRPASRRSRALTAAVPALAKNLALELAPVRVNLIAAGFVDTPLSASLLGDQLDARREQLRATLPIGRVVGPGRCRRSRRPHHDEHSA